MTESDALHRLTRLLDAPALSTRLGRRALFKMESDQPPGSFKLRGIGHLMSRLARDGASRFVSSSGGNAGLAVAWSAAALGVSAVVVVPQTTSPSVRERLQAYGAEVEVEGSVWDEADARARAICAETGAAYVPPFDHPLLWEGHATLVDEAARQGPRPAAVFVSVGGGGLLCGVLEGMARNGWADVPVFAAETEGAASYAAALSAGHPVTLPAITSVAKSLGALRVAEEAVRWARRRAVRSSVVSDTEALEACIAFADHLRVLVEPACGAALASALRETAHVEGQGPLLVIACGGAAVDSASLCAWRRDETAP